MCQKPFNVASNLKRHVRTHTNTKRKSSKNGSMVFRSFSHGALHKQSHGSGGPSGSGPEPTHAKSPSASSSSSSNTAASTTTSRRQLSLQQSDQLRWMNTETLVSGTMAASHQRAALKEKAGQGSNTPAVMRTLSSRSKTLTRPSMPSTPSVGSKSSSKALATATNATTPGARTILTSATITTMTDNIGSTRPPSLPAQTPPPTFSRAPSSSSDMLETKESQEPEESQEEYDGEKKKKAKKSYKGR
ncbi:hypothetical protein EDD21DRAFT_421748 [Dissophora ornata]|nr:hypothetical protein EDD21DRAFT_421748 [Dissophora ornata]